MSGIFRAVLIATVCSLAFSMQLLAQTNTQTRISVIGGEEHSPQGALETQLAAIIPQRLLDEASRRRVGVDIEYALADLHGAGQFDFVIAGYQAGLRGTIRAFQWNQSNLSVVGDPEGNPDLGGGRMEVELVDVQGTGKPDIAVRSFGANATFTLTVFRWTGSSLRLLNPNPNQLENTFGGAELFDVDSDGVLEIVTPSAAQWVTDPSKPAIDDTPFGVYKFDGTAFKLAFTSRTDPTGQITADGNNQSVAARSRMIPSRFSLQQIRDVPEKLESEEGIVTVRLGNLSAPADTNPGARSLNDVDLKSLLLGRNIHALHARIVPRDDDDREEHGDNSSRRGESGETMPVKFAGPFIEAEFSREALLKFLPGTQLTKPLAPGDILKVDLRGKMKNGALLFSSVSVNIAGEPRDKGHANSRGDN